MRWEVWIPKKYYKEILRLKRPNNFVEKMQRVNFLTHVLWACRPVIILSPLALICRSRDELERCRASLTQLFNLGAKTASFMSNHAVMA